MSQSLKSEEKIAILSGRPISCCGLKIYPIQMLHYEIFLQCKDALVLRQATLPVKFVSMDFVSAVFSYDFEKIQENGKATGLFYKLFTLLWLSLRIGLDKKAFEKSLYCTQKNGAVVLDHIEVTQDGKTISVKPIDFSFRLRPLIAKLNGLELPDETENLDLIRDAELKKQYYASQKNQKLNTNVDDLIASVAYQSRCRESDIYDWSIKEFEARKRAIDRDKQYMINAQAELSGMISFKNGNPAPSWCYDLIDDQLGTMSLSSLNFGNASEKKS